MSVGAVLIQPQRLDRVAGAPEEDAGFEDLVLLVGGVALDAAKDGRMLETFGAAAEAAATRFLAQAETGLDRARQRLGDMLENPVAGLQARATALGEIGSPDDALAVAHDVLAELSKLAEELTIDDIRERLGELVDVIETDLGLTPDFLEQQVWALIDDVVDRLEHLPPESDESLLKNRIGVIGAIRRLARRLGDEISLPELDVEDLSHELLALIRGTGIPDGAARAACIAAGMAQLANSTRDALRAVPFTGLLPGSISAGVVADPPAEPTEQYLWYPSWLATNSNRPSWVHFLKWIDLLMFIEEDEVVRSSPGPQIILRRWGRRQAASFQLKDASKQWKDEPRLPGDDERKYTFGPVSADALETTALVTSMLANFAEMFCHLASLERGDYASNAANSIVNLGLGVLKPALHKPLPWWLEGPSLRFLGTFLATLEGRHTKASAGNRMKMWVTLAGPDLAEMYLYRYLAKLGRDLILSTLTLANNKPPASPGEASPRNVQEVDAWRQVTVHLVVNLYLFAFKRENWGAIKPGGDSGPILELIFFWSLIGGICAGGVGGLLGCLGAQAIARDVDSQTLLEKMWWGMPQAVIFAPFWLYLRTEGRTDGGTFTPWGPPKLTGYPPKDTSPYLLPYDSEAVGACYVGQANQGLFSHNWNNNSQVYCYDFSLDQDDEILASRPGTVVAFAENAPNDEENSSNTFTATVATAIPATTNPTTIAVNNVAGFYPFGVLTLPGPAASRDVAFYTSIDPTTNTFEGVTWQNGQCANGAAVGTQVQQDQFKWNFVAIRHDLDDDLQPLTSPHPHDIGPGGGAITTIGIYGHGRTGSVTAAFQLSGIPTNQIIGTRVWRGMPIMLAGDTGISFHNHLHVAVIQDVGQDILTLGASNLPGGGRANSLPFVYGDVPGDGVPWRLSWYDSSNQRSTVPPGP